MNRATLSILAAGAALAAFAATPSQAALSLDGSKCAGTNPVFTSSGCKFNGGNMASQSDATAAMNLYNPAKGIDITLNFLGANNTGFGSFTSVADLSGTWSTPGYLIDFIAVKAGNAYILYSVANLSSGTWSTAGLTNNQNVQQQLSHIAYFGKKAPVVQNPVPEPASWAMLIAGMGAVGVAMRRRKTAVSFA